MKYIKTFEKMMSNFTLYHGSPNLFEKFKNTMMFFSDNPNFAFDYANEKSMDNELDSSPVIYTCKLNGKIFDANIEEHLDKLKNKLPDKITCYMTDFCFPHDYSKDDILELLKGDDIVEPIDYISNANVGDEVPDPSYKVDKMIIVKKDNDNVYTIDKKTFNYYLNGASAILYGNNHFGYDYRKHFTEFIEYIKTLFKDKGFSLYNIADHLTGIFLDKKYHKQYGGFEVTDDEYEKGVELYEKGEKTMMKEYAEKYQKQWNINPKKIKLSDTWRYYENESVSSAIKELGFSGYIAKEKKHNTYAIFNPSESITIETISYEGCEFKNTQEISNYNKLLNDVYKHYNSSLGYERHEIYNDMKNGLSLDEIISNIDKKHNK